MWLAQITMIHYLILVCSLPLCYTVSLQTGNQSLQFRMVDVSKRAEQLNLNINEFNIASYDYCSSKEEARLCPPWYFCNASRSCNCGYILYDQVKCDMMGNTFVLDCFCVTFDYSTYNSEFGRCLFNCENNAYDGSDLVYHQIHNNVSQLNQSMCEKFNRQGSLCGRCKDGFYPLAYSYDLSCVKCDDSKFNWLKYIVLAFIPLTIFCFIILFFQISVLHSHLYGFVLYSQAVSFPVMCRVSVLAYHKNPLVYNAIKIVGSLYGIWNLDFMRLFNYGICVRSSTLLVNSLDLAVGLYPLLLIFLTCIAVHVHEKNFRPLVVIVKPFYAIFQFLKTKFEIRTSLVDAFSTFLLLTNVKLWSVSFDTLVPVQVHILSVSGKSSSTYRLYFDATVSYLGKQHLPYATLCLMLLLLFVILPALILALYPFRLFQKYMNRLPHQVLIFIHTYVDIFYGCYKDGTEPGSKDCRWFASLLFVLRFFLFILYGFTLNMMYFVFASIVLVVVVILLIIVEPFKKNTKHCVLTTSFLLYLAGLYLSILGTDIAGTKSKVFIPVYQKFLIIFGTTPLFYATFLVLYWLNSWKYVCKIMQWMKMQRRGYVLLSN